MFMQFFGIHGGNSGYLEISGGYQQQSLHVSMNEYKYITWGRGGRND